MKLYIKLTILFICGHSFAQTNSGHWSLNNQDVFYNTGNVGIGTNSPDEKLAVNGTIHSKEVKVDLNNWPDYVFTKGYDLLPIEAVAHFIKTYGHLPNIPSADAIEHNGAHLGEMHAKLLEKIEELTLYILQQEKALNQQIQENNMLEHNLTALEKQLKSNYTN